MLNDFADKQVVVKVGNILIKISELGFIKLTN